MKCPKHGIEEVWQGSLREGKMVCERCQDLKFDSESIDDRLEGISSSSKFQSPPPPYIPSFAVPKISIPDWLDVYTPHCWAGHHAKFAIPFFAIPIETARLRAAFYYTMLNGPKYNNHHHIASSYFCPYCDTLNPVNQLIACAAGSCGSDYHQDLLDGGVL